MQLPWWIRHKPWYIVYFLMTFAINYRWSLVVKNLLQWTSFFFPFSFYSSGFAFIFLFFSNKDPVNSTPPPSQPSQHQDYCKATGNYFKNKRPKSQITLPSVSSLAAFIVDVALGDCGPDPGGGWMVLNQMGSFWDLFFLPRASGANFQEGFGPNCGWNVDHHSAHLSDQPCP